MENIIVFFTNVIAIIMGYLSIIVFKHLFNPIVVFNISWILVINISSFALFNLYKPTEVVYIMAILLIFVFNITCLLIKGKIKKTNMKNFNSKVNYRFIKILNYFGIIYLFPATIKSINIFLNQGATAVRTAMVDGSLGIESTFEWIITSWIVSPIFNATIIISIILYIFDNRNTKLIYVSLIDLILYTITFGGRWLILRFIIIILFSLALSYHLKKNMLKELRKIKRKLYLFLGIGVSVLVYITSQRGFENDVIRTMVIYFTGSLNYFNQHIKLTPNINHLYGTAFFSGLLDFPLLIFQSLFGLEMIRPAEYVGQFTSPNIIIGDGIIYNGFGSALLDFWLDFGVFGAVIDGIILAVIVMIVYKLIYKANVRVYSMYIFILMILVITPIKWEFDLQWSWMTIFFILLFTTNKSIKVRKRRDYEKENMYS